MVQKVQTDGLMTTIDAVQSKLAQPLPLGYCNVGIVNSVEKMLRVSKPVIVSFQMGLMLMLLLEYLKKSMRIGFQIMSQMKKLHLLLLQALACKVFDWQHQLGEALL